MPYPSSSSSSSSCRTGPTFRGVAAASELLLPRPLPFLCSQDRSILDHQQPFSLFRGYQKKQMETSSQAEPSSQSAQLELLDLSVDLLDLKLDLPIDQFDQHQRSMSFASKEKRPNLTPTMSSTETILNVELVSKG